MKSQIIKFVALIALFMGLFSCSKDSNYPQDESQPVSEQNIETRSFLPDNPSIAIDSNITSFAIDSNIISFEVANLIDKLIFEHPSEPGWGSPEGFSPHIWK